MVRRTDRPWWRARTPTAGEPHQLGPAILRIVQPLQHLHRLQIGHQLVIHRLLGDAQPRRQLGKAPSLAGRCAGTGRCAAGRAGPSAPGGNPLERPLIQQPGGLEQSCPTLARLTWSRGSQSGPWDRLQLYLIGGRLVNLA